MLNLAALLPTFPWVYYAISAASGLMFALICLFAVPAVFKVDLRKKPVLWALALLTALAIGLFRPWCFMGDKPELRDLWEDLSILQPFVLSLILVPFRHVWKGFATALGYVFVEAVKYIILLVVFRYNVRFLNDPFELLIEFILHFLFLGFMIWALNRSNEKRNIFAPFLRLDPVLYVLIAATVTVFMVSLALMGATMNNDEKRQFYFILLNIPLFAATLTYAGIRLVRIKTSEDNYRRQLSMQIKHYEHMEKMNEDLRIFRHDLPKKLRPMAAYLENDDTESAKEIAEELGSFTKRMETRFHTGNYRLDTVLFCQQQIAADDDIKVTYAYGSVFPAEGIDPDDIYTIFPNALDNAIEACRKVEGPREVTVQSRIVGDTVFVQISNPVSDDVPLKNGLPQKTSKANKKEHGYGLRSIRRAAGKYGEQNVDATVKDGVFTLRLSLTMPAPAKNG